jgi:serine/threonine protein kinase
MDALEWHTRIGELIAGKYRVERVLGSGGMGVVVAATHLALGHRVAIKLQRRDSGDRAGVAAARFVREARIAAALASEHIARVEDLGVLLDGTPFMVIEYLDGVDLRRLLAERGPLPVTEAVDLVAQACEGVAVAHAEGVVHRDLTPSNLFLALRTGRAPVVKVLDFGVAALAGRTGATLTSSQTLLGSPIYAAPEQLRSARNATVRSDVWSLGAVLYELLTGVPAFCGETIAETCAAVIRGTPRPLEEIRAGVPPRLRETVRRCLMDLPSDRFADAGELARELERFKRVAAIGTMDTVPALSASVLTGGSERAPRSDAPVAFSAVPPIVPSRVPSRVPSPRRRSLLWAIAVVQGIALVFGGLLLLRPAAPTFRGASHALAEAAAQASSAPARDRIAPPPRPDERPARADEVPSPLSPPAKPPRSSIGRDAGAAVSASPAPGASADAGIWPWGDRH